MDIFPPQNEVTGPNGEYGLLKSAGYATNLILTSYDRFFNKQIWTPLLGGDVFQIQMTRPTGESKAFSSRVPTAACRWSARGTIYLMY